MSAFKTRTRKPYSRPTPTGQWLHDKAPGFKSLGDDSSLPLGLGNKPTGVANTKLVISNLHYEIGVKDLSQIFGQIGTLVREPLIRYDRSGRSSGTAIVSYETATEATKAKKQFDGILAKGQPMQITYDTSHPRTNRSSSAPSSLTSSSSSLFNRIEKVPLAERLGPGSANGGPIRTRGLRGKNTRPGGAVGGPKTTNTNTNTNTKITPPLAAKTKPKTAEDLDKELDAFMGDAEPTTSTAQNAGGGGEAASAPPPPPAAAAQDVEMA